MLRDSFSVEGVLKGYDQLLNLVLDEVIEHLPGAILTVVLSSTIALIHLFRLGPDAQTRPLGLAVLRGPTITLVSPVDGSEEIANPFAAQE